MWNYNTCMSSSSKKPWKKKPNLAYQVVDFAISPTCGCVEPSSSLPLHIRHQLLIGFCFGFLPLCSCHAQALLCLIIIFFSYETSIFLFFTIHHLWEYFAYWFYLDLDVFFFFFLHFISHFLGLHFFQRNKHFFLNCFFLCSPFIILIIYPLSSSLKHVQFFCSIIFNVFLFILKAN